MPSAREEWRWVKGYEGLYKVSNLGNVLSMERNTTPGGMLSKAVKTNGYPSVMLSKDGKTKRISIHRLVAEAFLGDPKPGMQVNHKDGNRENNFVGNLEWSTQRDNVEHELYELGSIYKRRKLTSEQVRNIRRSNRSTRELAAMLHVSQSTIQSVKSGKSYKEVV